MGIASHVVGLITIRDLKKFKVHDVGKARHVVAFKNQGGTNRLKPFDRETPYPPLGRLPHSREHHDPTANFLLYF